MGCQFAALAYCSEASIAVFVKNSEQDPEITGCTGNCNTIAEMKKNVASLFALNAIDMVLEILAFIFLTFGILYIGRQIDGIKKGNSAAAAAVHPLTGTSRAAADTRRMSKRHKKTKAWSDFADTTQLWFGSVDCLLQLFALVYINLIDDAASPFNSARCLDTTTELGLKHHDTLTKLQESVSTSRLLGWVEMAILLIEIGIAFWEKYFKPDDDEGSDSTIFRFEVVIMWMLQLLNTFLAILDFSVFTIAAQNDADDLYNVTDSNTYRDWCVSVSNTSSSCIDMHRNQNSAGREISISDTGVVLAVSLVCVIVVVFGVWMGLLVLVRRSAR